MSNSCTRIWLNLNLDFKSNAASNLKQKAWPFKDELHPSWLQSYLLRMCCDISTGSISAMHTQVYFTMTWLGLMSWIVFCETTIQCLTIAGEFMLSFDQWKENRCSSSWWHLFWAFLMTGSPVACPSNCFFMRIAIYVINKLQPFVCTSELDGHVASSFLNLFSL